MKSVFKWELVDQKRTRFFGFWLVSLVVTPTHHQLTNPPPINTCMKEKGKFIPNKKNKVRENKRREEERVQERKKKKNFLVRISFSLRNYE